VKERKSLGGGGEEGERRRRAIIRGWVVLRVYLYRLCRVRFSAETYGGTRHVAAVWAFGESNLSGMVW
jgi:hypothetical protein